uniref:Uncharacterized protein n=1 Tax=Mus musculus TaxID=10090 RepID=Q9D2R5_MOUSE|nr:unnamed protein product [Mus musculus]
MACLDAEVTQDPKPGRGDPALGQTGCGERSCRLNSKDRPSSCWVRPGGSPELEPLCTIWATKKPTRGWGTMSSHNHSFGPHDGHTWIYPSVGRVGVLQGLPRVSLNK